jgi:hypothetical protein
MVNSQRGEIAIQAGTATYTFRMGLTALAKLETLLSTPAKRFKLNDVMDVLDSMQRGNPSINDLMLVLLAGFQEFHGTTVRSTAEVERIVDEAGGLDALAFQLQAIGRSAEPDAEDLPAQNTGANPRKAQVKRARSRGGASTSTRAGLA